MRSKLIMGAIIAILVVALVAVLILGGFIYTNLQKEKERVETVDSISTVLEDNKRFDTHIDAKAKIVKNNVERSLQSHDILSQKLQKRGIESFTMKENKSSFDNAETFKGAYEDQKSITKEVKTEKNRLREQVKKDKKLLSKLKPKKHGLSAGVSIGLDKNLDVNVSVPVEYYFFGLDPLFISPGIEVQIKPDVEISISLKAGIRL